MRILLFLSDLMIPLLFFYIIGFGLLMKKDIYNDFVTGAFDGLKIVVKIMPTLIGLMASVAVADCAAGPSPSSSPPPPQAVSKAAAARALSTWRRGAPFIKSANPVRAKTASDMANSAQQ